MKELFALAIFIIIYSTSFTQESKVIDTQFKVYGNCDQCKTRIEKALKINEVKYAKWNKSTKMLRVVFENTLTADSLQKRLASVGHDTDKYKSADETYANLPKCCLYRDKNITH